MYTFDEISKIIDNYMANYKKHFDKEWDGVLDFSSNRVIAGWHPEDKSTVTYIYNNQVLSCHIVDLEANNIPENFIHLKKINVSDSGIVSINAPKLNSLENIPFALNLTLKNIRNVEDFGAIKMENLRKLKLIDCVQNFKKFPPFRMYTSVEVLNKDENFKFESLIGLRTTAQYGSVDFSKVIINEEGFLRNKKLNDAYNIILNRSEGRFYDPNNRWACKLYETLNPTDYEQFMNLVRSVTKYEKKYQIDPWDITTLTQTLLK